MATASDRTQALQLLIKVQAELMTDQALRPGPRWVASVETAKQVNAALRLLTDDLGEAYVHAQLYGTRATTGHLVIGLVPRDYMLAQVQAVLRRLAAAGK